MLDGIIFDVDGTLWNACREVLISWSRAKEELYGAPIDVDYDTFVSLFGQTSKGFAPYVFPGEPLELAIRKTEEVQEASRKYLDEQPGEVFDGVYEMMETLSKTYRLFIVSNCQLGYIECMMRAGKVEPFITGHLCFGETMKQKNETIRILMEQYGLENVLYVGDTPADADACAKADVPFMFVEYGFGEVPEATLRAASVADIPRVIAEYDA